MNSQLESVAVHPNELIAELESLQNETVKTSISTKKSDEDFMIHVLNSLNKEYYVILDGMQSRLMMLNENNSNKLAIEDAQDKLSR